jgi:cellulose synthase/poly-beta-1,6-N-acetylglucosamine synthase-like glycosyltransferase
VTATDKLAAAGLLLILTTWVGYPLLVWALGRLRRPSTGLQCTAQPRVSVVIASRESADSIRARVENCLTQDYQPSRLDIVVALDATAKVEEDALGDLVGVRVVRAAAPGKPAALNTGVAAACGVVVVFGDSWQRFDKDAISRLVAALSDRTYGAVSGRLVIPSGGAVLARLYWRYESWLREAEARLHSTVGATGAIYAIRREHWQPLPEDLLLDDVYTPMRLVLGGHRVGYVREALAVELRATAPDREYQRKVRTLTGVLQVCTALPAVLLPWRNPIFAQFVIHKLFRMLTPFALLPVAVWGLLAAFTLPAHQLALLAAALGLAVAWVLRSGHRRARQVRGLVIEGALLQAAIVVAGINGMRGRWKVWNG